MKRGWPFPILGAEKIATKNIPLLVTDQSSDQLVPVAAATEERGQKEERKMAREMGAQWISED